MSHRRPDGSNVIFRPDGRPRGPEPGTLPAMRRRWLQGFVVGCATGVAVMVAGPLTLIPAAVLWWLALLGPSKLAAASGSFAGVGAGILLGLGPAGLGCMLDASCIQPALSSWVGAAVGFLILGIGVWMAAAPRSEAPPG